MGPQSTSGAYTYSLVSVSLNGTAVGAPLPFKISGDDLQTATALDPTAGPYTVVVQSTDALGNSIQQSFTITVGGTDPVTPTVGITPSNIASANGATGVTIAASQTTSGNVAVGTVTTTPGSAGILGNQATYSLVSGTGDGSNSLFTINSQTGQLETTGTLTANQTYTVRVRTSSSFELSNPVDLTVQGSSSSFIGPTTLQITLDPSLFAPGSNFLQVAANAGLISLAYSPAAGVWYPAVSQNLEAPGSLATPNYQGSYASFWSTVTQANPAVSLANVVGSSGVDQTANKVWAVVDQQGEYASSVQIFTEQVITITTT